MSLNPSHDTTQIGWQSEPNLRGTYTILSSCVSTLLICVLSAVHLNVPAKSDTGWGQTPRRAKWVFTGMFAPEVLVLTAFMQFEAAKTLTTEAQKLMKHLCDEPVSMIPNELADVEVSICNCDSVTTS